MTHDEAEFLMSQQLDGTLDAVETKRLHAAIDADAILAAMWREHQALDAALRDSRVSVTAGDDSEMFLAALSAAIDEEPERSLKISSWNWKMPLAAAAMLAIGLSIGMFAMRGTPSGHEVESTVAKSTPTVAQPSIPVISVAAAETDVLPTRGGYANVSVGIPSNLTPSIVSSLYVAERFPRDRVIIEAAGRRDSGTFE